MCCGGISSSGELLMLLLRARWWRNSRDMYSEISIDHWKLFWMEWDEEDAMMDYDVKSEFVAVSKSVCKCCLNTLRRNFNTIFSGILNFSFTKVEAHDCKEKMCLQNIGTFASWICQGRHSKGVRQWYNLRVSGKWPHELIEAGQVFDVKRLWNSFEAHKFN